MTLLDESVDTICHNCRHDDAGVDMMALLNHISEIPGVSMCVVFAFAGDRVLYGGYMAGRAEIGLKRVSL